ncbi:MAG: pyruvate, phosphate dikinase [Deltaproteobacteria bacterium]|jgi:pyruvate,orthophosphate dikinase|nr:pyruvate, phosphate dikinase [Deltaproteobacteria bacterium]
MAYKYVYSFGGGKTDGHGGLRELLGGKGANLAEMAKLGLPVPAGFTITTEVCTAYYKNELVFPSSLKKEVKLALARVEKVMGCHFGDPKNPLLVSCRSGARISMPGMMDTVLNIGLNDETVKGLIAKTNNPRFAYDSYRRFISMYGDVVLGVAAESEKAKSPYEHIIDQLKENKGYESDTDLDADDLKELVRSFKSLIKKTLGVPFPEDPQDQLWGAIAAVFNSWTIERAKAYRQQYGIPEDWGTAVNVQAMVFGNKGQTSATGVAFSRDPSTGENYFYGEYLTNAQGEDVVAGVRTPRPINRSKDLPDGVDTTLEEEFPVAYNELNFIRNRLENHYRDMQDIEFTIEEGKLWMLQCRNGKRTAKAALKIAVDLVKEKKLDQEDAILRVEPEQLNQLFFPVFNEDDLKYKNRKIIAKGLPASPGTCFGKVVFSASEAETQSDEGVILVRLETSPEDIKGMFAAKGILTARGGMTSHAAVVARGIGRTCVAGANITVDYDRGFFKTAKGEIIKAGDFISLDGTKGEVILGAFHSTKLGLTDDYHVFMKWVDKARTLRVRTNADTPQDAKAARIRGAEGIGLCRTEHMFFQSDRIDHIRAMILASDAKGRKKALNSLLPMQRDDFYQIFKAMDGYPVTIRTLDPPLHEFLPKTEKEITALAKKFSLSLEAVNDRISTLHEQNPMLGLRGCRLGIIYPEITRMQAAAIFEAVVKAVEEGYKVAPEIMIPLVGHEKEFVLQKSIVDEVAQEVLSKIKAKVKYLVGTMIELPRACLEADKIANAKADFFSFGTNDLTQTTYGLSRDDAGTFLHYYLERGIWEKDPFVSIDQQGMGQLIEIGVEKGRSVNKKLKIGICGEHGGEPNSVAFCFKHDFDYVSCSPHRVPLARLAAAQAAIIANKAPQEAKKAVKIDEPKAKASPKTKAAPKAKPAAKAKAKIGRRATKRPKAVSTVNPAALKAVEKILNAQKLTKKKNPKGPNHDD